MFAIKLVGDAIDRERCDQVVRELTNKFVQQIDAYQWYPTVTDFDVVFNDLKDVILLDYDTQVGVKPTDKEDSQNSIRRRILGRNIG